MGRHCDQSGDVTGKAAVRLNFIQRLEVAGLKRPVSCKTEADFDAVKRRLVDFLAYLSAPSLEALADHVLSVAHGKARNQCPTELYIRQMAEALERRPAGLAPIVTSWFASIEGPQALAAGHAVEMFRYLRRCPRPLNGYDRKLIAEDAVENKRARDLIGERQRHGIERVDDQHWLAAYAADLRRVELIVAQAAKARAEKEAMGEANA